MSTPTSALEQRTQDHTARRQVDARCQRGRSGQREDCTLSVASLHVRTLLAAQPRMVVAHAVLCVRVRR